VVCIGAVTPRGVSRIVSRLGTAGPVSVPRTDVDFVVTEYGAASLRGRTVEERARSLISIAHPGHRDRLAQEWNAQN
jgi:4-hydroxybutyrate CoA-transferase